MVERILEVPALFLLFILAVLFLGFSLGVLWTYGQYKRRNRLLISVCCLAPVVETKTGKWFCSDCKEEIRRGEIM
jgi:hypothetical protein